MQVGVETAGTYQLVVRSLFFDHASVQHDNTVNPFERGDPMRNKDDRLMGKVLCQMRKHPSLGWRVECRCRFVKQEKGRVLEHGTS